MDQWKPEITRHITISSWQFTGEYHWVVSTAWARLQFWSEELRTPGATLCICICICKYYIIWHNIYTYYILCYIIYFCYILYHLLIYIYIYIIIIIIWCLSLSLLVLLLSYTERVIYRFSAGYHGFVGSLHSHPVPGPWNWEWKVGKTCFGCEKYMHFYVHMYI